MKRAKTLVSVYGLLALAMLFLFFSGGDRPVEIAVWLSPLLLLRFFREVKPWKALLFALPCMIAVSLLADKGMMPFPMSIAIVLTVINSAIALIPYLTDRLLNRSLPLSVKTLLFPSVAVAAEAFLASFFTGGTWGNVAYGIQDLALLQLVSVTGLWGMMFLIYWVASVINEIWEHRHCLGDIRRLLTVFMVFFIFLYAYGLFRLHYEKTGENTARVAGITPGPEHRAEMMEIFGKIFPPNRNEIFDAEAIRASINDKYQELLSKSIKMAESGVEIVVWSEGATFIFESDEETYIQRAVHSAREHEFYLGMGIIVLNDNCLDLLENNQPFVTNKLLFIAPDGHVDWEYSKSNLAPGYERAMTIPGDSILKSTNTTKGTVTGAICYDLDFPQYIRQTGVMKSDLLIAPSNDWPEIKKTHAKMARLRAIENGISLLRPASSGLSTAVDPYGNIVSSVDDFKSNGAPLVAVLPLGSVQTLYTLLGAFWTWICAFGGFILIVLGIVRRWRERHAIHSHRKVAS
jgi:apolipoprotein N-acyltransferase